MKKLTLVVRILMGLVFFGSGVAFFFTTPPPIEGPIATFFAGIVATKYFLYLLKVTEIVCGLMLLSGRFVPLALVILAPITLNIFLLHVFIAPEGTVLAVILGIFQVYLSFFSKEYSPTIKLLFRSR